MPAMQECKKRFSLETGSEVPVILWLSELGTEQEHVNEKEIILRLRKRGRKVYVASFPQLRTSSLFVGNSIYSGEGLKKWLADLREEPKIQ